MHVWTWSTFRVDGHEAIIDTRVFSSQEKRDEAISQAILAILAEHEHEPEFVAYLENVDLPTWPEPVNRLQYLEGFTMEGSSDVGDTDIDETW